MKKIAATKVLKTLDGEELKISPQDATPLTVRKVMEVVLTNYKGQAFANDHFKTLEMARMFHDRNDVLVDKADFQALLSAVKENQNFTVLVLGQIIEIFNEAPDEVIKAQVKS